MNINGGFDVAPKSQGESSIECVAKSEVKVVMMANHMHEYGIAARTDVVRAGTGVVDVLRDDPVWDYEMQFNPEYAIWPAHDPLVIRPGGHAAHHLQLDELHDREPRLPARDVRVQAAEDSGSRSTR